MATRRSLLGGYCEHGDPLWDSRTVGKGLQLVARRPSPLVPRVRREEAKDLRRNLPGRRGGGSR